MRASSAFRKATSNGALWMMSSASRTKSRNSAWICANVGSLASCSRVRAVHLQGALVDVAIRIQVAVKGAPGQAAIVELDAANLDDAMVLFDLEAGGLGIENDLPHQALPSRQQAVDGAIRQLIDVFIAFVTGMSLDPMPLDILPRHGLIELLP